jgi:hypothetical protein
MNSEAKISAGWRRTEGLHRLVPEPETYTMLLAGLGLIGIVVRRRKQNVA